ncbi:MAG: hypothetical protein KJ811_02470, partial [Candidatus Margulisbacteria bacterium]|nr:hypothetical protein [Candidatus Margulisiibacteriota bacterium]
IFSISSVPKKLKTLSPAATNSNHTLINCEIDAGVGVTCPWRNGLAAEKRIFCDGLYSNLLKRHVKDFTVSSEKTLKILLESDIPSTIGSR